MTQKELDQLKFMLLMTEEKQRGKLKCLKAKNKALADEVNNLRHDCNNLNDQLCSFGDQNQALDDEINNLKEAKSQLETKNRSLDDEVKNLKDDRS